MTWGPFMLLPDANALLEIGALPSPWSCCRFWWSDAGGDDGFAALFSATDGAGAATASVPFFWCRSNQ